MQSTPNGILEQLLVALDAIEINAATDIAPIVKCAELSRTAVRALESFLETHSFSSKGEQIHFFKVVKPRIEGRLLYYLRLTSILQLAPIADEQERKQYWKSHLVSIEQFYRDNAELHFYYRMDYTYLDDYYFSLLETNVDVLVDNMLVVMDRRFNTRKSNHFAHFFAYELLSNHLNMLIADERLGVQKRPFSWVRWTGSQSQLVELIYAVNETGVLGGKKVKDMKTLFDFFSFVFNTKITNGYATHVDNRMRKKNRCAYLDELRLGLEAKYNHDDLHAL